MNITKSAVLIIFLCLVNVSWSKPAATEYVTEGRGIGSTIWGWITYPFSWWSSSETEQQPKTEHLLASTSTYSPSEVVALGRPNITVWCNDQTCTTITCGKNGCRNVTCNIYDTNMNGECREYTTAKTIDEDYVPNETTLSAPAGRVNVTTAPNMTSVNDHNITTTQRGNIQQAEERPIELEVVLSSTVSKVNIDNHSDKRVTPPRKI